MHRTTYGAAVAAAMMMFSAAGPICAQETTGGIPLVPDTQLETVAPGQTGTVSITLTDSEDGRSKEGVELGMIQVADVINGEYQPRDLFALLDVDLNDIETAQQMEDVARQYMALIKKNDIEVTSVKTDVNGQTKLNDLGVGVYLIYMLDAADFEFVTPFLVAIPTFNEVDGQMSYDLDVVPKHSQLPKFEVNKVDASTGQNITSSKFEFTSYEDENCKTEIETVPGDTETGTALFEVDYGVTYIKETAAPQGYLLSDEVVKIEVSDDGIYINDKKAESDDELLYSIIYENSMLPSRTGAHTSLTTNAALYIGAAVVAIGGLTVVILAKRRQKHCR
ncbi:MSCRAMM family protein [Faecalibaculum rodentium]|uniref:MSCRAMM family protein n=2 Tax=Faecalibaculum rodentium TaxID=1702221 RepID=UPI00272C3130|nr:prealbumin-like fold domain-containing protein [Faecalibaculum rodentium]